MAESSSLVSVTIKAPAKINLYLRVKGRRPDGYHDLQTLMQKLALADELRLTRSDRGIRLACPGTDLPQDAGNLAYRAAAAFFAFTGFPGGVEILLRKRIPIAAGLGGGSSDAAAVLLGLNRLFAAGLEEGQLLALARPLGADVPFFVVGASAALAEGIGDRLQPVRPIENCWVLLVNPGFPVSTRWVYENLALTTKSNLYMLGPEQNHDNYRDLILSNPLFAFNDLESVTIKRFPAIGKIKEELRAAGAKVALMSGSGPTVFGLFTEEMAASRSLGELERRYGENVFLTKPHHML